MSTQTIFDNKVIKIPGAYSTIKSGVKNTSPNASYGKVLIIDNGGIGATWGGGAGIDSALVADKQECIYSFKDLKSFRTFIKGGMLWDIAEPLFKPLGIGSPIPGVSEVLFVKAATTVPAEIAYTFSGGGTAGGALVVQVRDEGVIGNGFKTAGNNLYKGYGAIMSAGLTSGYFVIKFYRGTWVGPTAGSEYNNLTQDESVPELLCTTPEFNNIQTVIDWMDENSLFNTYFYKKTGTKTGTGVVDNADLTANSAIKLAAGGIETYSTANLSLVLENIINLDYTFVLADKYGDDAQDTELAMILSHLVDEARYDKFMFVGGGLNSDKFADGTSDGSIEIAQYYDSDRVCVIHGGYKKASNIAPTGFIEKNSLYTTAAILGRVCGLQPQVPATFKSIKVDGLLHNLTKTEEEAALDNGVMHLKYDAEVESFIINKGINSLQKNTNTLNEDGTSHNLQLKRISAQLNKELVIKARKELLADPNGVNRNTLSSQRLKDWTASFLQKKIATPSQDNLIISFQDIVVTKMDGGYSVEYGFIPNGEVDKLFFTGTVLDI